MDERQRCKATRAAVVCASTESGQRVRLNRAGAAYEGEGATRFPAPAALGVGNEIETASGIRCLNSSRGIECSHEGHGFVIGDSAVVIQRGSNEQRYEATSAEAVMPAPPELPVDASTAPAPDESADQVCWPGMTIPAQQIPAVQIPPTHIPATTIGGVRYPAQTLPGIDLPARTLPAVTVEGSCYGSSTYLPPAETTVLVSGYEAIDRDFSEELTRDYWDSAPASLDYLQPGFTAASIPDVTAPGFGELNGAGYPKNQYVRSYVRRDGTAVRGYWRNSPSDGLPTCRVITC